MNGRKFDVNANGYYAIKRDVDHTNIRVLTDEGETAEFSVTRLHEDRGSAGP
jgi:hypothetical protein